MKQTIPEPPTETEPKEDEPASDESTAPIGLPGYPVQSAALDMIAGAEDIASVFAQSPTTPVLYPTAVFFGNPHIGADVGILRNPEGRSNELDGTIIETLTTEQDGKILDEVPLREVETPAEDSPFTCSSIPSALDRVFAFDNEGRNAGESDISPATSEAEAQEVVLLAILLAGNIQRDRQRREEESR